MSEQNENLTVPGTDGLVDQERLQAREQNLDRIRELGALAEKVNAGNRLRESVDIDHTTDLGHYTGTVKFKRPDAKTFIRIGAYRAQLLQANFVDENGRLQRVDPIYIDEATHFAAEVLATLGIVIVRDDSTPAWLKNIGEQYDFSILAHVYERFQEWTNSFRINRGTEGEGDSGATGTAPNVAG